MRVSDNLGISRIVSSVSISGETPHTELISHPYRSKEFYYLDTINIIGDQSALLELNITDLNGNYQIESYNFSRDNGFFSYSAVTDNFSISNASSFNFPSMFLLVFLLKRLRVIRLSYIIRIQYNN